MLAMNSLWRFEVLWNIQFIFDKVLPSSFFFTTSYSGFFKILKNNKKSTLTTEPNWNGTTGEASALKKKRTIKIGTPNPKLFSSFFKSVKMFEIWWYVWISWRVHIPQYFMTNLLPLKPRAYKMGCHIWETAIYFLLT